MLHMKGRFHVPDGYDDMSDAEKLRALFGLDAAAPDDAVVARVEQLLADRHMWKELVLDVTRLTRWRLHDAGFDELADPTNPKVKTRLEESGVRIDDY